MPRRPTDLSVLTMSPRPGLSVVPVVEWTSSPKRGDVRAWHFAHKVEAGHCAPETVLHASTKYLIAETFNRAAAGDGPCYLYSKCASCGGFRKVDLPRHFSEARTEVTLFEGSARADVVLYAAAVPRLVIEVVVSHTVDPKVLELYREAALPTFVVRPTWHDIAWGFHAFETEVLWTPRPKCSMCEQYGEPNGFTIAEHFHSSRYANGVVVIHRNRDRTKRLAPWSERPAGLSVGLSGTTFGTDRSD